MTNSAVLILHGWNIKISNYKPLVNRLKEKKFAVYIPNLPGFGVNKTIRKPLTLNDYALFVNNYIKKNNLKKPIVIGHSFGGRITILLAAKNKNIFSRIILTGVPLISPISSLKVRFYKILAKTGKIFFRIPIISYTAPFFRKILYFTAGSFDYYKTSGNLKETFKNIISFDLQRFVSSITIPTLIVWGVKDKVTPLWIGRRLHQEIKNSKLVLIEKGDHNVVYKEPDLFLKHVL